MERVGRGWPRRSRRVLPVLMRLYGVFGGWSQVVPLATPCTGAGFRGGVIRYRTRGDPGE